MLFKKSRRRKKNPGRRRASSSRSRKRRTNPSRRRAGRARSHTRRRNPSYTKKRGSRRKSSSRRRKNPSFGGRLKAGLNKTFVTNALLTSGGLIIGTKSASLLASLPMVGNLDRFLGLVNVVVGGVGASMVKSTALKSLFMGIAAGGAYNVIAKNIAALGLNALEGDELLGVEVNMRGEQQLVHMNGVEVNMHGGESLVVMGEGSSEWEGSRW